MRPLRDAAVARRGPRLRGYARLRALDWRERTSNARGTRASGPRSQAGSWATRFVVTAREPALSRAAGRCAVRRHHRSHRHELHPRRASGVLTPAARLHARGRTSIGAFIVDGEIALQVDAAPRRLRRKRIRSSRGAAQLNAVRASENRRRSPRRAVQPNQTPSGWHGRGVSRTA